MIVARFSEMSARISETGFAIERGLKMGQNALIGPLMAMAFKRGPCRVVVLTGGSFLFAHTGAVDGIN